MTSNFPASKLETVPISLVPLALIDESPTNPRKTFHGIEELAENIKARGVLQAVMVRPRGQRYELVFGARRFRAAKLAELETIPASVREISDHEVIELQLIENAKREDISPLEEADGYRELIDHHGYTPDELAAKVNKSRRTIYERLQMCKLGKEGRAALDGERLHLSVAILVARIPAELQAKAVQDLAARDDLQSPMTFRSAVDHIQEHFMRQLKDAPFDVTDAQLVPKAGACSVCPKRTGNQRELFADVKSADVCTDPKCYRSKEDVLWQLKVKEAESKGQKVLNEAATKTVFPYGNDEPYPGSAFRALHQEEYVGGKLRKVKTIVGKDAQVVLARAPSGRLVELVSSDLVKKKIRELEPKVPSTSRGSDGDDSRAQEKKYKLRKAVVAVAMAKIVEKVEKGASGVWRFVADSLVEGGGYHDAMVDVARRRGVWATEKRPEQVLGALVKGMNEEQLRGFIVEILTSGGAAGGSWSHSYAGQFPDACKAFGVDLKKTEAAVRAEKNAPKAKAAGVCILPGCGQPGTKVKGSPGLWCESHGKTLSAEERKSIALRAERLAGETKRKGRGGKGAAAA